MGDYQVEILEAKSLLSVTHVVRLFYLVPSNRTPEPNAVSTIQNAIVQYQAWYADQMQRNGFGSKTFRVETGPDGKTPLVHVVNGSQTDAYYRADPYTRVAQSMSDAGLPMFRPGEVWLGFDEDHVLAPDGTQSSHFGGGATFGSGDDGGFALVSSDHLATMEPGRLLDDRSYDGQVWPELGPYPLKSGVSFPSFEGSTFSSVASAHRGAVLHELSHAFGLDHDFRNDRNFNGDVMGNGLRGFRGWVNPVRYPQDDEYLSAAAAMALNTSRYFNPDRPQYDDTKPVVSVLNPAVTTPSGGHLGVHFTASDANGLTTVQLFDESAGGVIADIALSGISVDTTLMTPNFTPGQATKYRLTVYDAQGNRQQVEFETTPAPGPARGPEPLISVGNTSVKVGAPITLDASGSVDPDGDPSGMKVEWDLNGDGTFDTSPSTSRTLAVTFPRAGTYLVRARLTDARGFQSISEPIPIRVVPGSIFRAGDDFDGDGKTDPTVFRPSTDLWVVNYSSGGKLLTDFGDPKQGDIPVPGDYDGDGKTDLAVFRPATDTWIIRPSSGGPEIVKQFGDPANGDVPIPGDYEGNGKFDLALFRARTETWIVRRSDGSTTYQSFGDPAHHDLPVPGDYEGIGKYDLALFRPDAGLWIVRTASGGTTFSSFGDPLHGDIAAPGDYDGDGKVDLAIFRPQTALFVIQYSSGALKSFTSLGDPFWGDLPVAAPLASLGLIKPPATKALPRVRPAIPSFSAPIGSLNAVVAVAPWFAPVNSPDAVIMSGVHSASLRRPQHVWLIALDDLATELRDPWWIDGLRE